MERKDPYGSDTGSIFSRFMKVVTDQINTAEKMPEVVDEAFEAEDALTDLNLGIERSFASSQHRLKIYFRKKSFSITVGSKQFWKPDSSTRVCYDCNDLFTAIRRRHHCRICGEIFCSKCCDRVITGKLFRFTGEIRSCEFCCKVLVTALSEGRISSDQAFSIEELRAQLRLFNFDHSKFERELSSQSLDSSVQLGAQSKAHILTEENHVAQTSPVESPSIDVDLQERLLFEKNLMYNDKDSLLKLRTRMVYGPNPLPLNTHWHHMRSVSNCFTGKVLADWLLKTRISCKWDWALVVGYNMLLANYITGVSFLNRMFYPDLSIYVICPLADLEEPNRLLPREIPNWEMKATNCTDNWAAAYGLKMPDKTKDKNDESGEELDDECSKTTDSQSEETKVTKKCLLKEFEETANVAGKNIAAMCPSYYLNRGLLNGRHTTITKSPEPMNLEDLGAIYESIAEDSISQEDFNLCANMTSPGRNNPSALDDMPLDRISSETEQDAKKFRYSAMILWSNYEERLLKQLIEHSEISEEWIPIIRKIAHSVCKMVKLDIKRDEDQIDIRRFVKFKKVRSDGNIRGAKVLHGVVCTKNILQKGMKESFKNPQILLIKNNIDLPNSGVKYLSLKYVMEHEAPYMKNISDKIIALNPDIVMVGRQIVHKALKPLMDSGITVIANIKKSIMERVCRATQAQMVNCIDSQLTNPVLGTCRSFYLKPYVDGGFNKIKTLMFFNSCPAKLDCTVILSGSNYDELYHVKRIAYLMLMAVHNFTRETAFLREISASLLPVLRSSIISDVKCRATSPTCEPINTTDTACVPPCHEPHTLTEIEDTSVTRPETSTETAARAGQPADGSETIVDFSDPLQSFLERIDRLPERRPLDHYDFASALSKVVLSISPYYSFHVPYLESANGKKSHLITYFTPKPYSSPLFEATRHAKILKRPPPLPVPHVQCIKMPLHPFVTANITKSVDDDEVSALIADFRARGGPFKLVYSDGKDDDKERSYEKKTEKKPAYRTPHLANDKEVDALHPINHQSISLLYCCFSRQFEETSKFCVDPCFIQMDFYGRNDITLGKFLDQYCFTSANVCPSHNCSAPTRNHVRKFCHANGSVEIMLRLVNDPGPTSVAEDDDFIRMWTWCTPCNKTPSIERNIMSDEVYNFSFAKYLELRFYQHDISSRGDAECHHSILQQSFHYFKKRHIAAIIRYNPVDLRELAIPPTKLAYTLYPVKYSYLVDQLKVLVSQGGSVFMAGFEQQQKLADEAGANQEPMIKSLVADQVQHRLLFKEKQTSIQNQLSDEAFSNRIKEGNYNEGDVNHMYLILDEIVNAKILLLKVVTDWDVKIQEFMQIKKKEEKARHLLSPKISEGNAGQPSEDARLLDGTRTSDLKPEIQTHCVEDTDTQGETKEAEVVTESDFQSIGEKSEAFIKEQKSVAASVDRLLSAYSEQPSSPPVHSPPASITLENIDECSVEVGANAAALPTTSVTDYGLMDPPELPADVTESPDRKSTVKQLISRVWSAQFESLIRYPFSSWEHYGALSHAKVPIAIIDEEPSSFIAHCLASKKYEAELSILQKKLRSSNLSLDPFDSLGEVGAISPPVTAETITPHIELQFKDHNTDFYIKIICAEQFRKLRSLIFPYGERTYIRSLARCIPWEAKGGKSGSAFCKTTDDRFVLKGLSKREAFSFMQFGPYYIQYIIQCHNEQQPTVLAKILGVYYTVYKNSMTGKSNKITFLVMENLFYRRKISHKFDLKGSVRNRMVDITTNPESEIVLMDQNLAKMACSSPLFLREHSKEVLKRAVESDTDFLCKQVVIDYSLLVGVDEEQNELVVGIIDFIRGYTFDKKLESIIKQSINPKETPTVVPPEIYRARFCKAMNKYFLCMPDRWYQFGTKFQSATL